MAWLGAVIALLLIVVVLTDAFAVIILPRRVSYRWRLTPLFYRTSWSLWRVAGPWFRTARRRTLFLSVFGPLSLLGLISLWAFGLIVGYALLHWSLDTPLAVPGGLSPSFGDYLYFSGVTFFTLGYGDIVPLGPVARSLSVLEAGMGFAFLATIITYLPVLYQAFSRRETTISLLDARAGSPPTAVELLRRLGKAHQLPGLVSQLVQWERWSAELLESHISYPVLSYYRSQHDNQSWVGALTAILDTCAMLIAGVDGADSYQARLTFAMARHAAVDLGLVFRAPPRLPDRDRLPVADFDRLRESLRSACLVLRDGPGMARDLCELRRLYEPFVHALADYFVFTLPPFQPAATPVDNWQTSAWMPRSPGFEGLPGTGTGDEHFD